MAGANCLSEMRHRPLSERTPRSATPHEPTPSVASASASALKRERTWYNVAPHLPAVDAAPSGVSEEPGD